jgi:membrane protease YdiL (CAAX protease family)
MSKTAGGRGRCGMASPLTEISLVMLCVLVAEWAVLPLFGRSYLAGLVPVGAAFALLHLPNPWLTPAAFCGGLLWAWTYQRAPNLWALAFSHSLMTVVLVTTVPYSALGGMRVGYGYFL